jgi:hypothetical protein
MKKCTGCGRLDTIPLTGKAFACCPDNNYKELTSMQELIELIVNNKTRLDIIEKNQQMWLQKEKEQIITDYSNGFINALGYKKEDKNIEYGVIMQSKAEADIYYNEKYNQKL